MVVAAERIGVRAGLTMRLAVASCRLRVSIERVVRRARMVVNSAASANVPGMTGIRSTARIASAVDVVSYAALAAAAVIIVPIVKSV